VAAHSRRFVILVGMPILDRLRSLRTRPGRFTSKGDVEMEYWRKRFENEGTLRNAHYERFYTSSFGLTAADYAGKRVPDVGCGPRGTLEWADGAFERIGLDPLAEEYRRFGTDRHAMTYVAAGAEAIPFPDGHFDIVTAFNALDHVDDVDAVIRELTRVARHGATGLLLVEVNHAPTMAEPHFLEWDLLDRFSGWRVVEEGRVAMGAEHNLYGAWESREPWSVGSGVLGAKLERTE
jgi:SAM-dependent methyltransferase